MGDFWFLFYKLIIHKIAELTQILTEVIEFQDILVIMLKIYFRSKFEG